MKHKKNNLYIVRTWCENTKEGKNYLQYNNYDPICRLSKNMWLCKNIGTPLRDVKIVL